MDGQADGESPIRTQKPVLNFVCGGCLQPTAVADACVAEAARRQRAASDRRLGSTAVAAGLGLSASRLQHLFAQHIGVPMRSYRRWCRLQDMARAMAAGQSLTAAAHEAGFHDSAHMNRAFRQSFGIVPTFVFRPGLLIDVVEREG